MSWSVQKQGTPTEVLAEVAAACARHVEGSRMEFEAARPHIEALVKLNFNNGAPEPQIRLWANGHAYGGASQVQIKLERV